MESERMPTKDRIFTRIASAGVSYSIRKWYFNATRITPAMIHDLTRERLLELKQVLGQLDDRSLSVSLDILQGATLGMHIRHILEFYQCLFESLEAGELNYDLRKRDVRIETSGSTGVGCIDVLLAYLQTYPEDIPLRLQADYSTDGKERKITQATSYFRELLYNIEHCVHHLAIIRIGMRALDARFPLDEDLGVAASTIRNRNICAR